MSTLNPLFTGTIADNKLTLDNRADFYNHLAGLEGKRVQVTVERVKVTRSTQQNRWYWGIAVKMISDETGHTPDEVHAALKLAFSPKVMVGNLVAPKSTKTLDTIEFGENMMERVVQWAAEVLHINLPLPDEVKADM